MDWSFRASKNWDTDPVTGNSEGEVNRYKLSHARKAKMSLSGSERNHLFVKSQDGAFVDVSGNSGLDLANDGRSIGVFDFDRDGLQDFLLTNANGQTLSLFRNQIGKMAEKNQFVAIRLVGGNKTGKPSSKTNRKLKTGPEFKLRIMNAPNRPMPLPQTALGDFRLSTIPIPPGSPFTRRWQPGVPPVENTCLT